MRAFTLGLYLLGATTASAADRFAAADAADHVVVIEYFKNLGCAPCSTASRVLEDIVATYPLDATLIANHIWFPDPTDPFYVANAAESMDRFGYYGADFVPHIWIDGIVDGESNGAWESLVLARAGEPSPISVSLTGTMSDTVNGEITASVSNETGSVIDATIRFILVENDIPLDGKTYSFTMRDHVPDPSGMAISVPALGSVEETAPFTLDADWARENMTMIVLVQDDATREILQGARIYFELDSPELAVAGRVVTDDTGDGDGRFDPGETGDLAIVLTNVNPAAATGVTGTLTSMDPRITVLDGAGGWSPIDTAEEVANAADPFRIAIDPDMPWGTEPILTLSLVGDGGYDRVLSVQVPIGSPLDPIGPDAHGYYAYDDLDLYDPAPAFEWLEIDPTLGGLGTLITLVDDETEERPLPFTFRYYGEDWDFVSVSTNGWMAIGPATESGKNVVGIPSLVGPARMVAGMWIDLDTALPGSGQIYEYHDVANGRFVVEYSAVARADALGMGQTETFQIVLYDPAQHATPTGDGDIVVQYLSVGDTRGPTSGIEDGTELIGIEYLGRSRLNASAAGLVDGRAIRYTTVDPLGTVAIGAAGGFATPHVTVRPNPFSSGTALTFSLDEAGAVALRIFAPSGTLVRELHRGALERGTHTVRWDGTTDDGRPLPPGVYVYRLETAAGYAHRKIVRIP